MTASERILDKLLARLVRRGTLTLTRSDGAVRTYGTPEAGFPEVAIRFADPAVGLALGYSMNQMGPGILLNERGQSLVDAAYACCG